MKFKRILIVLFVMAASCSTVFAAALDDAREARLDRNYAQAAAALKSAAASDPKQADVYLYLLADSLARDKKCAEAVQTLDTLLKQNVTSKWYNKALFKKADCLMAMGRYKEADEIYEGQAKRALGEERKLRIASVYIGYADSYFKPEKKDELPDYTKAALFYTRALQFGVSDEKMFSVRLRIGLCHYNLGNANSSAADFSSLLDNKGLTAEIEKDAMYYLGLSRLSQGQSGEARNVFRKFIAKYPDDKNAPDAAFRIGATYNLPNPGDIKQLELGVKALKDYIEKYSTHEKAAEAAFQIAQSYYNMERYEEAINALESLIAMFGSRSGLEQVPQAKILLGNCYFDQEKYEKAIEAWKRYQNEHPTHSGWSEAGSSIIDAEYEIAATAMRDKKYSEAAAGFQKFLEVHALEDRAIDAMYELGDIEYVQDNYKEAIRLWKGLVSKYPDSDQASHAQFQIAEINEKKYNDPEAAETAYKLVAGSYQPQAQQRLSEMRRKQLTVLTERAFTTSEKPVIKITVRNMEKLQVKAYRIDVETYFKKFNTIRGIENLDIALIDPDTTFEYTVKNYKKMQSFELPVVMPFKEEGVWAVTIGDDELESTTMMVVTNIAAIIKSSKNSVFVFAEDMRDGTPAKDARVLISDGSEIFEAGKTGADGVLQYKGDKVEDADDLTVLVLKGAGAASDKLSVGDLSFVEPSRARGILYTERPAYRPGQKVNAKGIVRETKNGDYAFKAGDKYYVSVLAPGGVEVSSKNILISDFGTFAVSYDLPPDAPVGLYTIQAVKDDDSDDNEIFSYSFKVEEYKIERIKLAVETTGNVYFRGETIKGKIKAEYYFGQPVAGKKVDYRISTESKKLSGETDKNGEIEFSYDTDKFEENTSVSVYATLSGENVSSAKSVWVAATEFDLAVSTVRDVYLAGESIEVTAKSRNLEGEPVKSDVRLEVLSRITTEDGETAESRAQEMAMNESEKGISRATVKLSKGGYYVLRVFSRDRFMNPVAAERVIFVSGDEDTNRLRIITEKEDFYVGETPSLKVVYREKPALALVTYEGESVYRYKLVPLKQGENSLPINITDELAPNFTLGIAVMQQNNFHVTDKSFGALKGLSISLKPEKETYLPGEKMKLKVKTTDKNGKAVKAELSLALVDEALYTLYSDDVPPLGEFFFGGRRAGGLKTISSNTFSYAGVTKEISKELVEQERLADYAATNNMTMTSPLTTGSGAGGYRSMNAPKGKPKMARKEEKKRDNEYGDKMEAGEMYDEIYDADGAVNAPAPAAMYAQTASTEEEYGKVGDMKPPAPVARLREFFPETGYWNPSVITGADGSAEVTVPMPDTATKWRLTTRGATVDTLVGEQTAQITTKQDFFVSVKQPAALVEGSRAGFVVEVHNLTGDEQKTEISAVFSVDGAESKDNKTVTVGANTTEDVLLQFNVPAGRKAFLTIDAAAGSKADKVKVEIPVSPYGVELASVKSGTASENTIAYISLPAAKELIYPEMYITVSTGMERSVLDIDFPGAISNNSTALEALSVVYRLDYLEKTGAAGGADAKTLSTRLQGLVMRLVTNMNPNGYWAWTQLNANRPQADVSVTSNAVWALALAQKRGVSFPQSALDGPAAYLLKEFSNVKDDETKAQVLHALSYIGKAEFAYINRLDRDRSRLSVAGLSYIALSYINQARPELASDVATVVEEAAGKIADDPYIYYKDGYLPPADATALRGLAMLSIGKAKPASPVVKQLKDKLEADRRFGNWWTPEATMSAGAALAVYYSKAAHAADKYTLSISVNGKNVKTIKADSQQAVEKILVPKELVILAGENKVAFTIDGRGSFGYSVVITGFSKDVPAAKVKSPYISERKYLPAPPKFNGKEYAPGFSVVTDYSKAWFENTTADVAPGDYVTVNLSLYNYYGSEQYQGMMVVEDGIPAGTTIDKDSISGNFENYEIKDGRIIFYCSNDCYSFSYRLYGYLSGSYKQLPSAAYPSSAPLAKNYLTADNFKVLSGAEKPAKEYKFTPDQLYNMGKDYFDAGMKKEAASLLGELIAKYELTDEPFRETHRMLMYVCIEQNDSKCIVDHFEQLKERYPSLSMEFKDVLRVGRAYHDIGESERAIQVYRTALESSFMTDGETRVFLEDQGRFLDSLAYLEDLTLEYPDLNIVQNAVYSNAQALYSKSANVNAVPELKEKGYTRGKMLDLAADAFRRFMLLYPESSYIDEASFSLASTYFDSEKTSKVIELAQAYQKRYPKSPLLDSFQYIEAYAHFELGEYEKALDLCKKISEGRYHNASGELTDSDSRNLALYITAQIYHTLNKPDKAAEYYEKISGQFADAAGALEYFNVKTFSVPELSTAQTGKPATVKFTHRNIADADLMVYRVDLMKFYLMRKSLKGMAQIQLSGIKPIFEKKLTLGKGREYRDVVTPLELPVPKDGAYLVVLRSGSLYSSGMLLRSNLEVEVQEEQSSGRVRVNVMDSRTGKYVSKAHVKIVGSSDGKIRSGNTDLRGIFTADSVSGLATVLVKYSDQYAFHSGESLLNVAQQRPASPSEGQVDYMMMRGVNTQNIVDDNKGIQMRNDDFIRQNFKQQKGVQIEQLQEQMMK